MDRTPLRLTNPPRPSSIGAETVPSCTQSTPAGRTTWLGVVPNVTGAAPVFSWSRTAMPVVALPKVIPLGRPTSETSALTSSAIPAEVSTMVEVVPVGVVSQSPVYPWAALTVPVPGWPKNASRLAIVRVTVRAVPVPDWVKVKSPRCAGRPPRRTHRCRRRRAGR